MKILTIKLLVISLVMFAAGSAFASFSYDFNVNTSLLAGQGGYIELQFNPGISSTANTAIAVISNFTGALLDTSSVQVAGLVNGTLPSLSISSNNTSQWNDYYQALTFGSAVNFALNLSGAAGNSFGLSFFDANGNYLFTSNPLGFATTIDVNQNGPVVTNNSGQVTVTATPIPTAAWLLGTGLIGLVGIRRKIRN